MAPPLNATTSASATGPALQPFDPMNLASRLGQAAGAACPAA
ncbi:MAG TPA: hypothetical protein VKO83_01285 [Steroidobacteraceae bacterium]|nr:hypothetical protein [Steroidobacteraceae bacterium]